MNITILGSGVYGLSMAIALSKNKNNKITLWTESSENIKKLEDYKKHGCDAFNGIKLPKV
jgi:glycerol-3-phosphate dehydrogenase